MNVRIHCNVEVNITDTDADTNNVVYLLTFENGKYYVGLTTQKLIERISAHCSNAFNLKNTKYKTKVYGAIRKYMKFTATILYVGDNLEEKEIYFIDKYNSFKHGYNLTTGGELKKEISPEVGKKISKANKGRTVVNKGIPMSEEQKKLVSKRCKTTYENGRVNPLRKAVLQLDLNDNVIAEFVSMTHADEATGVSFKKISACCNGKRKTSGGYKWKLK